MEVKPGQGNTDTQSIGTTFETGAGGGTTGGSGAETVNGSTVKLPFGLDPAVTPILGSYQDASRNPRCSPRVGTNCPNAATTPR